MNQREQHEALVQKMAQFISPEAFWFGQQAIALRPHAIERARAALTAVYPLIYAQARDAALDEAAKVAEDTSGSMGPVIAAAIRALKGEKPPGRLNWGMTSGLVPRPHSITAVMR